MPKPKRVRPKSTRPLPSDTVADTLFRSLATVGNQLGTHAEWVRLAVETIRLLALERRELTAEDLYSEIGRPDDARMAGTAFRDAARAGYVVNSGRTVRTERSEGVENPRARRGTVWESTC